MRKWIPIIVVITLAAVFGLTAVIGLAALASGQTPPVQHAVSGTISRSVSGTSSRMEL